MNLYRFLLALVLSLALAACQRVPVELNTAKRKDLESVKEIGSRTSEAILYERKRGDFKDWNDFIARVKGIGPKSAAKMSADGLIINGQKMPDSSAASPAK